MTADFDLRLVRRLADMNAVYRMYGHTGELLYVGMTGQTRRFDDHAVKRWFPLVSRIALEWHQTEASARVAERRAIETERPRYNIAHTPRHKRTREAAPAAPPTARRPERDVLLDVLRIFGDGPGLWWQAIAERLAEQIPSRWAHVTPESISAECRALGVPSVCVRMKQKTMRGCRRSDLERVATERLATG